MANPCYYATINGQPVRLSNVRYTDRNPAKRAAYEAGIAASETGKIVASDAYSIAVGVAPDGSMYEADRLIFRKANPSNHKCGARCRNSKGGQCECECGGKYHGAGNG